MYHRLMHAYRAASILLMILILLLISTAARARPALDFDLPSETRLTTGAASGAAAWGDFDNDNDLDLVVTGLGNGSTSGYTPRTILYENNGITLAEITSGIPNDPAFPGFKDVESSSVDLADYNRDGYLDVLLAGLYGVGGIPPQPRTVTKIYYNSSYLHNGIPVRYFVDSGITLPGIYRGRGAWGDYDNDGLPDFILTGYQPSGATDVPFTALYHNNGGSFTQAPVTLPALGDSYAAWGDYNRDGFLDFALMGKDSAGTPVTNIYRNNGNGTFTAIPLPGQALGQLAWADVDADGDLDLLVSGSAASGTISYARLRAMLFDAQLSADLVPATHLYRNDAGIFTEISDAGLPALSKSAMSFGDYDNDGDPDLLLNGQVGYAYMDLWVNDGTGHFTKPTLSVPFDTGSNFSVAWGDFNKDNSLDAMVTGILKTEFYNTNIYLNAPAVPNTAPAAPVPASGSFFAACWAPDSGGAPVGGRVVLRWSPPSGDSTPPAEFSYNVRLGTTAGGAEILRPAADPATGYYRLARPGNGAYRYSGNGSAATGSVTITGLDANTTYHWAVSAVDASFIGGPFTAEQTFTPSGKITAPDTAVTLEETPVSVNVTQNDQAATVFAVDLPEHGTAAVDAQNNVVYTPAANFIGVDSVTYYAIDAAGKCNLSTLSVTVNNRPDPPTLSWRDAAGGLHSGPVRVYVDKNSAPKAFALTLVGKDPDAGEQLTWSIAAPAQHGATSVAAGPTASGDAVTPQYTPAQDYIGFDTFTVRATDSTGLTGDLLIQVTVGKAYRLHLPRITR